MSKEVKISVIKFEMVNGKKTYKSFTFKLNPKDSVNAARRSCSTRVRTSNTSWEAELT